MVKKSTKHRNIEVRESQDIVFETGNLRSLVGGGVDVERDGEEEEEKEN